MMSDQNVIEKFLRTRRLFLIKIDLALIQNWSFLNCVICFIIVSIRGGKRCSVFFLKMVVVLSRFLAFTNRHPIVRGMISYATIWPVSNLIQQSIAGKSFDTYDWMQSLRFAIYGSLFTAPTLYAWVRLSSIIWQKPGFKTALTKAVVEQMSYGPAALICFYFGMSILEGKTIDEAVTSVKLKFLPSWQVGIFFWPVLQTINFAWVPEKNRVPYVSVCSLIWCCFLSYMHQKKQAELQQTSNLKI